MWIVEQNKHKFTWLCLFMADQINIQHLIYRSVGLVRICIIRGISEFKMAVEKLFKFKIYLNKTNSFEKVNVEIKRAELTKGLQ